VNADTLTIATAILYAARAGARWPETPVQRERMLRLALTDANDIARLVQRQTVPPPGILPSGVKSSSSSDEPAAGVKRASVRADNGPAAGDAPLTRR
jgi:hypothetical protein